MAITINWPTGVINVPKADLTLIQSSPTEIRELNLNWFRLTLKDLEDDDAGMPFPKTHTHNTEVSLGGLTFARVVEILDPYSVTFEDGQYAVNLVGANSNVGDKVNVNQVSVRSANSAGLISTPLIEYASFEGAIWIDQANGISGTIFPIGTHLQPVNNLTDAKIIDNYRGFKKLHILGYAYLDSGLDFSEYSIVGDSRVHASVLIASAANTTNATFKELTLVSGSVLDGGNEIESCRLNDLVYFNGTIHECSLGGTIYLGGGVNAVIEDCYTRDPYNIPVIDVGGSGQNLAMPNYSGLVQIKNLNDVNNFVGIGLNAGQVRLDSGSVLAGTIHVSGNGTLLDNYGNRITSGTWNGNVTIINTLVDNQSIVDGTWDTIIDGSITAQQSHRIMLSVLAGKTNIINLGGGLATVTFRDVGDLKDRLIASMSASIRTNITIDAS